MRARSTISILMCGAFFILTACTMSNSKLKPLAEALSRTADQCLYEVRDKGASYETSQSCSALKAMASAYIDAGGFGGESAEIALVAERARVSAWMARAASLPGGKGISIW